MPPITSFNSWIFGAKPDPGARLRLFCFPHAGSGASVFRPWIGLFPADIEVCPVQLPGRENRMRDPLIKRFNSLIEALVENLLDYFDRPFAFFGHSMGALLSFGLTQQLRRQNHPIPLHLFISSYRAPQILNPESPLLHTLSEQALVQTLLSLNGTKREILENDELRRFLLPILRADFAVCETFEYLNESPLACPISAFGGLQDTRVSRNDIAAWNEQTSNRFTLRMMPGDHFYLERMRGPLVQRIAHELMQNTVKSGGA